jgi:ACR3 family arsenite transporter
MTRPVVAHPRLSFLDRYLTVWICGNGRRDCSRHAGAIGSARTGGDVGRLDQHSHRHGSDPHDVSAAGQGAVRGTRQGLSRRQDLALSFVLCWVIAPAFMFALAALFLPDRPEYLTGLS